ATATSPYTRIRKSFSRSVRSTGATAHPLATGMRPAATGRPPGVEVALVIRISAVGDLYRPCSLAPGSSGPRQRCPERALTRPGESWGHTAAPGVEKSIPPLPTASARLPLRFTEKRPGPRGYDGPPAEDRPGAGGRAEGPGASTAAAGRRRAAGGAALPRPKNTAGARPRPERGSAPDGPALRIRGELPAPSRRCGAARAARYITRTQPMARPALHHASRLQPRGRCRQTGRVAYARWRSVGRSRTSVASPAITINVSSTIALSSEFICFQRHPPTRPRPPSRPTVRTVPPAGFKSEGRRGAAARTSAAARVFKRRPTSPRARRPPIPGPTRPE